MVPILVMGGSPVEVDGRGGPSWGVVSVMLQKRRVRWRRAKIVSS